MVSWRLSARLRRTGRFPRPRSPGEEQRYSAEPAALAGEADAAWALPGATAEDLKGPEESGKQGVSCQKGHGVAVRVGRAQPPPPLPSSRRLLKRWASASEGDASMAATQLKAIARKNGEREIKMQLGTRNMGKQ